MAVPTQRHCCYPLEALLATSAQSRRDQGRSSRAGGSALLPESWNRRQNQNQARIVHWIQNRTLIFSLIPPREFSTWQIRLDRDPWQIIRRAGFERKNEWEKIAGSNKIKIRRAWSRNIRNRCRNWKGRTQSKAVPENYMNCFLVFPEPSNEAFEKRRKNVENILKYSKLKNEKLSKTILI